MPRPRDATVSGSTAERRARELPRDVETARLRPDSVCAIREARSVGIRKRARDRKHRAVGKKRRRNLPASTDVSAGVRRTDRQRLGRGGVCVRSGKQAASEDDSICEFGWQARRIFDRERYADRWASGFQGEQRCGVCAAVDGGERSPRSASGTPNGVRAELRRQPYCSGHFGRRLSPTLAGTCERAATALITGFTTHPCDGVTPQLRCAMCEERRRPPVPHAASC